MYCFVWYHQLRLIDSHRNICHCANFFVLFFRSFFFIQFRCLLFWMKKVKVRLLCFKLFFIPLCIIAFLSHFSDGDNVTEKKTHWENVFGHLRKQNVFVDSRVSFGTRFFFHFWNAKEKNELGTIGRFVTFSRMTDHNLQPLCYVIFSSWQCFPVLFFFSFSFVHRFVRRAIYERYTLQNWTWSEA